MYAKCFVQMFDGSLCTHGPWEALVTFQQLLILADQEGQVDMTASAISRRTTIPLDIIEKGIEALLKADPESRTPTEDGKRIVPLREGRSWGWRVVNYKHYRGLKREEERREYHRQYWHKRKNDPTKTATESTDSTPLNTLNRLNPSQPIAEAEAEAKTVNPSLSKKTGVGVLSVPPAASPLKKESKKGTRLPENWSLPMSWGRWALTENRALTAEDVRKEAAKFKNHWLAKAGKDAVKVDWCATWRNWITSDFVKPSGTLPAGQTATWFMSATGITEMGATAFLVKGEDEHFPAFRDRVFKHFNVTEEMIRKAKADA